MSLFDQQDKNNLHHAYLIEGEREVIFSETLNFIKKIGIETSGNPDFYHSSLDSLKVDDAFNLRSLSKDKGFTSEKKIFIISTNTISLDAQNVMLKMFEEPISETHFFIIVPEINSLLKTFVSRFYVVKNKPDSKEQINEAQKFVTLNLRDRLDYIKDLLVEEDEEDSEGKKIIQTDSPRSKSILFLNSIETAIHAKFSVTLKNESLFHHLFQVRKYLRMPGSSTKSLMESVAIIIPNF